MTVLPLESLWNEEGPLDAFKRRELSAEDIKAVLRLGTTPFVVADCGLPLVWVAPADCYDLWKREIQPHLYDEAKPYLDDYPSEYFYFAYEWQVSACGRVVVLEKSHWPLLPGLESPD